jgi:uncharacterized protein YeaO (DUF488 family)
MIKTKSIYAPREDSDGKRILVTRYYPRGIRKSHFDIWDRRLAPSKELLADWKANKLTESEYSERFFKEMKTEQSKIAIDSVSAMTLNETVTLLCIEKEDGTFCHRHLLKKLMTIYF